MPNVILCPCGKCLRPKADSSAAQLRCPFCGRTHTVAPVKQAAAPTPASTPAPPRKPQRAAAPSRTPPATPQPEPVQAWILTHSLIENLAVLTKKALYTARLADDSLKPTVAALQGGQRPEDVLGAGATVVPLRNLRSVEIDRAGPSLGAYLTYRYRQKGALRANTLFCPNNEVRDQIYEGLRQRLGSGWTETQRQVSRWVASGWPLGALVGVLIVLAVFLLTVAQLDADLAAGQSERDSFLKAFVGWILDRMGSVIPSIGIGVLLFASLAWLGWQLIAPPLLTTLKRLDEDDENVPAPAPGWSRYTLVIVYGFVGFLVFGILWWSGVVVPRWIAWINGTVLIALYAWAWWTEKPPLEVPDTPAEDSDDEEEPAPAASPQPPAVVLPEGVKPAPDTLRCAACKESEVLVLPPNLISRRPGYICPRCGALMRPQRSTGIYLGLLVLGGFGLLLGLVLVVTFSFAKRDNWSDERVKASGQLLLIGFLVTGFAFHQLRRPTPLGHAPAAPIPWWPWLVALAIVLLGFCVLGGGIGFILYYIQYGR